MLKIYHNPRCKKSREGLALLEESGQNFEVIKYLDKPLSTKELEQIISKLNIDPLDLVRKHESIWKSHFKDKEMSSDAIIKAMIDYPKLMERPIVVKDNKAIVGRPPKLILSII